MKKYKVTFLTKYQMGLGSIYSNKVIREIVCEDFEVAFYKAKHCRQYSDINSEILAIEEIQDD